MSISFLIASLSIPATDEEKLKEDFHNALQWEYSKYTNPISLVYLLEPTTVVIYGEKELINELLARKPDNPFQLGGSMSAVFLNGESFPSNCIEVTFPETSAVHSTSTATANTTTVDVLEKRLALLNSMRELLSLRLTITGSSNSSFVLKCQSVEEALNSCRDIVDYISTLTTITTTSTNGGNCSGISLYGVQAHVINIADHILLKALWRVSDCGSNSGSGCNSDESFSTSVTNASHTLNIPGQTLTNCMSHSISGWVAKPLLLTVQPCVTATAVTATAAASDSHIDSDSHRDHELLIVCTSAHDALLLIDKGAINLSSSYTTTATTTTTNTITDHNNGHQGDSSSSSINNNNGSSDSSSGGNSTVIIKSLVAINENNPSYQCVLKSSFFNNIRPPSGQHKDHFPTEMDLFPKYKKPIFSDIKAPFVYSGQDIYVFWGFDQCPLMKSDDSVKVVDNVYRLIDYCIGYSTTLNATSNTSSVSTTGAGAAASHHKYVYLVHENESSFSSTGYTAAGGSSAGSGSSAAVHRPSTEQLLSLTDKGFRCKSYSRRHGMDLAMRADMDKLIDSYRAATTAATTATASTDDNNNNNEEDTSHPTAAAALKGDTNTHTFNLDNATTNGNGNAKAAPIVFILCHEREIASTLARLRLEGLMHVVLIQMPPSATANITATVTAVPMNTTTTTANTNTTAVSGSNGGGGGGGVTSLASRVVPWPLVRQLHVLTASEMSALLVALHTAAPTTHTHSLSVPTATTQAHASPHASGSASLKPEHSIISGSGSTGGSYASSLVGSLHERHQSAAGSPADEKRRVVTPTTAAVAAVSTDLSPTNPSTVAATATTSKIKLKDMSTHIPTTAAAAPITPHTPAVTVTTPTEYTTQLTIDLQWLVVATYLKNLILWAERGNSKKYDSASHMPKKCVMDKYKALTVNITTKKYLLGELDSVVTTTGISTSSSNTSVSCNSSGTNSNTTATSNPHTIIPAEDESPNSSITLIIEPKEKRHKLRINAINSDAAEARKKNLLRLINTVSKDRKLHTLSSGSSGWDIVHRECIIYSMHLLMEERDAEAVVLFHYNEVNRSSSSGSNTATANSTNAKTNTQRCIVAEIAAMNTRKHKQIQKFIESLEPVDTHWVLPKDVYNSYNTAANWSELQYMYAVVVDRESVKEHTGTVATTATVAVSSGSSTGVGAKPAYVKVKVKGFAGLINNALNHVLHPVSTATATTSSTAAAAAVTTGGVNSKPVATTSISQPNELTHTFSSILNASLQSNQHQSTTAVTGATALSGTSGTSQQYHVEYIFTDREGGLFYKKYEKEFRAFIAHTYDVNVSVITGTTGSTAATSGISTATGATAAVSATTTGGVSVQVKKLFKVHLSSNQSAINIHQCEAYLNRIRLYSTTTTTNNNNNNNNTSIISSGGNGSVLQRHQVFMPKASAERLTALLTVQREKESELLQLRTTASSNVSIDNMVTTGASSSISTDTGSGGVVVAVDPLETVGFVVTTVKPKSKPKPQSQLSPTPSYAATTASGASGSGGSAGNCPYDCDVFITLYSPVVTAAQKTLFRELIQLYDNLPCGYHTASIQIPGHSPLLRQLTLRGSREEFIMRHSLIGLRYEDTVTGVSGGSESKAVSGQQHQSAAVAVAVAGVVRVYASSTDILMRTMHLMIQMGGINPRMLQSPADTGAVPVKQVSVPVTEDDDSSNEGDDYDDDATLAIIASVEHLLDSNTVTTSATANTAIAINATVTAATTTDAAAPTFTHSSISSSHVARSVTLSVDTDTTSIASVDCNSSNSLFAVTADNSSQSGLYSLDTLHRGGVYASGSGSGSDYYQGYSDSQGQGYAGSRNPSVVTSGTSGDGSSGMGSMVTGLGSLGLSDSSAHGAQSHHSHLSHQSLSVSPTYDLLTPSLSRARSREIREEEEVLGFSGAPYTPFTMPSLGGLGSVAGVTGLPPTGLSAPAVGAVRGSRGLTLGVGMMNMDYDYANLGINSSGTDSIDHSTSSYSYSSAGAGAGARVARENVHIRALTSPSSSSLASSILGATATATTVPMTASASTYIPPEKRVVRWPHHSFRFMFLGEPLKQCLLDLLQQIRDTHAVVTTYPHRDKSDHSACLLLEGGHTNVNAASDDLNKFMKEVYQQMRCLQLVISEQDKKELISNDLNKVKDIQGTCGVHLVLDPLPTDMNEASATYDLRLPFTDHLLFESVIESCVFRVSQYTGASSAASSVADMSTRSSGGGSGSDMARPAGVTAADTVTTQSEPSSADSESIASSPQRSSLTAAATATTTGTATMAAAVTVSSEFRPLRELLSVVVTSKVTGMNVVVTVVDMKEPKSASSPPPHPSSSSSSVHSTLTTATADINPDVILGTQINTNSWKNWGVQSVLLLLDLSADVGLTSTEIDQLDSGEVLVNTEHSTGKRILRARPERSSFSTSGIEMQAECFVTALSRGLAAADSLSITSIAVVAPNTDAYYRDLPSELLQSLAMEGIVTFIKRAPIRHINKVVCVELPEEQDASTVTPAVTTTSCDSSVMGSSVVSNDTARVVQNSELQLLLPASGNRMALTLLILLEQSNDTASSQQQSNLLSTYPPTNPSNNIMQLRICNIPLPRNLRADDLLPSLMRNKPKTALLPHQIPPVSTSPIILRGLCSGMQTALKIVKQLINSYAENRKNNHGSLYHSNVNTAMSGSAGMSGVTGVSRGGTALMSMTAMTDASGGLNSIVGYGVGGTHIHGFGNEYRPQQSQQQQYQRSPTASADFNSNDYFY